MRPAPRSADPAAAPASPHAVRLGALAAACLVSFVVGLALEIGWSRFATGVLDASTALASLQPAAIVVAAVVPVVGNGLGFFMTHRRPSPRSRLLFTGPSLLLAGVGLAAALARLPDPAGLRAVVVTVVVVLITPLVTLTVLLARRGHLVPGVVAAVRVPPAA